LAEALHDVFGNVLPSRGSVTISRVVRIRPTNEDAANPGPIKVTLASKEERDVLLQGRRNLPAASKFNLPFFCPEYSLAERLKHRLLQAELHQRREAGEKNLTIRNGKVVRKRPALGLLATPITISGGVVRR
jgi:hypothetical protein